MSRHNNCVATVCEADELCRDKLLKVFYRDREFYVAIEIVRPRVATGPGAAEACDDRVPWTRDRVLDHVHDTRD